MVTRFLHSTPGRSIVVTAGFALLLVGSAEIPMTQVSASLMAVGWGLIGLGLLETHDDPREHW